MDTQDERMEDIAQLEEAQEKLQEVIEIVKEMVGKYEREYLRRTLVANLEMACSSNHSWLGKEPNIQEFIESLRDADDEEEK